MAKITRWLLVLATLSIRPPSFAQPPGLKPAPSKHTLNLALWKAVDEGKTAQVKDLLKRGASPDSRGSDGTTALMTAAYAGKVEIAQLLLNRGARLNARSKHGSTALMMAFYGKSPQTARLLIQNGANVNLSLEARTALHLAVAESWDREKHWDEIVRLLLQHGAEVNPRHRGDYSPLMVAAGLGSLKVAQMLIDAHADVNLQTRSGATALMMASDAYSFDGPEKTSIAQLLLKHGAAVDTKTRDKRTALMIATRTGATDTARVLLAAGADGEKARLLAMQRKRAAILRMIHEKALATKNSKN